MINNVVPKLLIFDGQDRTGKSSTMQAVWKARGKIDTCIDRGIISNLVYNKIYDRNVDESAYISLVPDSTDVYYFVFFADIEVIQQRMKDTSHAIINSQQLLDEQQLFMHYFTTLKSFYEAIHFVLIDTTKTSQEEIVKMIVDKIAG